MVLDSVQRRAITGRYRPTERSCAPCVTGTGRHRAGYCLLCSGVPRAVHRYRAPRSGTAPGITCYASVSLPLYVAEPRGVTGTARRSVVHPLSIASSLAPRREGHKKRTVGGLGGEPRLMLVGYPPLPAAADGQQTAAVSVVSKPYPLTWPTFEVCQYPCPGCPEPGSPILAAGLGRGSGRGQLWAVLPCDGTLLRAAP